MSRDQLGKFFEIVRKIIERHFGVFNKERKTPKGVEKKYKLNKRVVATLHLFGKGESSPYNPHINVLIFEDYISVNKLRISRKRLQQIKESYRKALQNLLRISINTVDIHYSYHRKENELDQCIWYMTIPFNIAAFERYYYKDDLEMKGLIFIELLKFYHVRFWGNLANSEYKKHLNTPRTLKTFSKAKNK